MTTSARTVYARQGLRGDEGIAPLQFDLNLDPGRDLQIHKSLYGLLCRPLDVHQALVGSALKLLAAILVLVNRPQDGDDLFSRRQGDGSRYGCPGALRRLDNTLRRLVDELVIIGLESDSNHFLCCSCHVLLFLLTKSLSKCPRFLPTVPCVSFLSQKSNRPFSVPVQHLPRRYTSGQISRPIVGLVGPQTYSTKVTSVSPSNLPLHRSFRAK